jgi:hypothetical protein
MEVLHCILWYSRPCIACYIIPECSPIKNSKSIYSTIRSQARVYNFVAYRTWNSSQSRMDAVQPSTVSRFLQWILQVRHATKPLRFIRNTRKFWSFGRRPTRHAINYLRFISHLEQTQNLKVPIFGRRPKRHVTKHLRFIPHTPYLTDLESLRNLSAFGQRPSDMQQNSVACLLRHNNQK